MPRFSAGLGLSLFSFGSVSGFWRWVDLCEEGGVDSLWQSDRLISTEPLLESMTLMAALAGRTRRLKFGMNVVSLAFREPVLLAKQCATIDVLSQGRLLPAFGIGSPLSPEWAALGIDTKTRGARADEALAIISRLWREDHVSFSGKHFSIHDVSIAPKPVQTELPLWIGGSSEGAIKRTARFGTGWQSTLETPGELAPLIERIRAAVRDAGRIIDDAHFGVNFAFHFGRADDPAIAEAIAGYEKFARGRGLHDFAAIGDADVILERLQAYIRAGACKFVLRPLVSEDEALMAQTERLIADVLPVIARWNMNP